MHFSVFDQFISIGGSILLRIGSDIGTHFVFLSVMSL